MTLRQIRIGSLPDIVQYDDADYNSAIETDQPIKAGKPIDLDHVLRLGDIADILYPIGCIYISTLSTNPNTILGFGTWIRVAEAQYLVGFKTGDTDFGTVEATGGGKTHKHTIDVPSTTSSASSDNVNVDSNGDGTVVSVSTALATHTVDPASFDSGNNDNLPPFYVIYIWKRTA